MLFRPDRCAKHIIWLCMLVCFTMAYLPITSTWFLSFNGRSDLSALVTCAVRIKTKALEPTSSPKKIAQSLKALVKELKIAAGLAKVEKIPDKNKICLIEIMPEFPVKPAPFRLKIIQKSVGTIFEPDHSYTSVLLLIDPPPPRYKAFST